MYVIHFEKTFANVSLKVYDPAKKEFFNFSLHKKTNYGFTATLTDYTFIQ